ncbi:MAG: hypothetical protein HY753_05855 [Nitrospirae bacterium]|nr:hypothetical protein [Nitrospirota bacterium]
MGIVKKKIGRNEYAYLVVREGQKLVYRYIGTTKAFHVAKIISDKKDSVSIPDRLGPLFWDTSLDKIHIRRNARYIIERVLEFGDMYALKWIQKVYPVQTISDVLNLSRVISEKSREFWMIWFGVKNA